MKGLILRVLYSELSGSREMRQLVDFTCIATQSEAQELQGWPFFLQIVK